jgi:hypothetical protein
MKSFNSSYSQGKWHCSDTCAGKKSYYKENA